MTLISAEGCFGFKVVQKQLLFSICQLKKKKSTAIEQKPYFDEIQFTYPVVTTVIKIITILALGGVCL